MNPSHINELAVEAGMQDARRRAQSVRRARTRRSAPDTPDSYGEHVVIRSAALRDERALTRLAGLDGAAVPSGFVLVAEQRGELVAAIDVHRGAAIANPFRHTADIVRLLELRAAQLRAAEPAGVRGVTVVTAQVRAA